MHWQSLIVALVVTACGAYALWALKLPLPALLAAPFERASRAASGCGCDGCDRSELKTKPSAAANAAQPLTFHPRPPR